MKTLLRTTGAVLSAWWTLCPALAQTTQPLPGLTEEQTSKVLRCRAIIENTADSENTRRGQAEELLQTGWSPAIDVLVELLSTTGNGVVSPIVARGIANVGRDHPERLDPRLVEPLLRLLVEGGSPASSAASAALSGFRDDGVFQRLGALAADGGKPMRVRQAAIDALAPNIDLRPAIAELMPLLKASEAEVVERALAALTPASRTAHGRNLEDWRKWWEEKRGMDETAWLRDRLDLLSRRTRDLHAQLEQIRRDDESRYSNLAKRLGDVLRLNLRLTPQQAQKDELLVGWLRDPLVDLRLAAVTLLAEQIYDQQRPSEPVRTALRERYADPSVEVRRAALELVGALGDPGDVEPILLRLAVEHDVDVRETIFGVLGKLRNPAAIGVLIDEIADESALSNCVIRAAMSLAVLAREGPDPSVLARAVTPLQTRLARQEGGDARVRGAFLAAMAGIASPEFTPEFVAHLSEDDPEVLLPSIRGLMGVGDGSQSARLRVLMGHDDARVRTQAIEAVGALGGDTADLEALLARLSVEPNEVARGAAWSAFSKTMKGKPPDIRLVWAERLKDLPEKQIEYLTGLVEDFAASNSPTTELLEARERLGRLLLGQKRYSEAVRHLEALYELRASAGDSASAEVGVMLLDAILRCGRYERLDGLLPRLASLGESARSSVVHRISAYLSEALESGDAAQLPELVGRLERVSDGLYGDEFRDYLSSVRTRLTMPAAADSDPKT